MREDAFFFYGTLMDRDLLSAVLGRQVWPRALAPAVLRGYRRSSVPGASYPVVLRQRRHYVRGVILRGVRIAEIARLSAYEGDGYELVRAVAGNPPRAVLLFAPKPGAYSAAPRQWWLAGWSLRHKISVIKALAPHPSPRLRTAGEIAPSTRRTGR